MAAKKISELNAASSLADADFFCVLQGGETKKAEADVLLVYTNAAAKAALSATAPIAYNSSTGVISIPAAATAQNGYLSSTDWNTFNGKLSSSRAVNTTAPITGGGALSGDLTIAMAAATASVNGYLASADFVTFRDKPTLQAGGTYASPLTISAAGGITFTAGKQRQVIFTKSNGGAVLVTATPQIQVGTILGQELIVCGTDDTNYIGLSDGNGLKINGGPYVMTTNTVVGFMWNGVVWQQTFGFGV